MLSKQDYTQQAIAHTGYEITADEALVQWWWHTKDSGLRLTEDGYAVFANMLDLQCWKFRLLPEALTAAALITLDRRLQCPYYLRRHRRDYELILFGSREAMMAMLYGDIQRFIASLGGGSLH